MNFHFTDSCRRLLAASRDQAVTGGLDYLGSEQMLLGALTDPAVRTFLDESMGVAAEDVRERLLRLMPGDPRRDLPEGIRRKSSAARPGRKERPAELAYTGRAKKVLEFAMSEAREAGDDYVGPLHILLGLIREEGLAAQVLAEFDVTLPRVRTARAGGEVEPRSRPRIEIDDASDLSIYEQIVAQITEAVATGTLRPGERLSTVRQLADELDIAPGTVARAYSELERQGLVVTEGARGTWVAERAVPPPMTGDRVETLAGLLRPVVVAAFHLGGNAAELRAALEQAMAGIFDRDGRAA